MAQLPRVVDGLDRFRSPAQRRLALWSEAWRRGAESQASDLDLVRLTRTNLLIIGKDDDVARLITTLWASPSTAVVVRHRGERLQLPPVALSVATVVVYDVDTLTLQDQHALHEWMSVNPRTQVVSVSSRSLQMLLGTGGFDEELYYRLNVMMLDLTSPAAR